MSETLELFRAEWRKISGNRLAIVFTIWGFPLAFFIITLLFTLFLIGSEEMRIGFRQRPATWGDQALLVWQFVNNQFGRVILLIFAALVFAGEYQWGTWKNIVPRRARAALILMKFATFAAFIITAFLLTSIIAAVGAIVLGAAADTDMAVVMNVDVGQFARDYALQASVAFASAMFAAAYAALGGMLTRSILGGIAVGFILTMGEQSLALVSLFLFNLSRDASQTVAMWSTYTPAYNLSNITSWVQFGQPFDQFMRMPDFAPPHALNVSMLLVGLWIVGLIALVVYLFRRQDILG